MGQPLGRDHILPAVLEFREETEEIFFNEIIAGLDINNVQFRLAPTYTLYMATRFRASTHYRPELIPEERAVRLTDMLNYVADQVSQCYKTFFPASLTVRKKKLECLSVTSLFRLVLYWPERLAHLQFWFLASPKNLPITNTLAYFAAALVTQKISPKTLTSGVRRDRGQPTRRRLPRLLGPIL
jgi:hypothetical protein